VVNATPQPFLPPEHRPGTHYTGGWVDLSAGAEKLAPTEIRSPDLNNNSLLSDTQANSRRSAAHIHYGNFKFCIVNEILVLNSLLFTT